MYISFHFYPLFIESPEKGIKCMGKFAQLKGRENFKGKNIKNKPFHVKRLKIVNMN